MNCSKQEKPPQHIHEVENGEDQHTKGRENETCQEMLQETSDGGSRFQADLEQHRKNMGMMETSKKG